MEYYDIYDGVLFWACYTCLAVLNDWPQTHPRWIKAERVSKEWAMSMLMREDRVRKIIGEGLK
jgi:hypothetical protein